MDRATAVRVDRGGVSEVVDGIDVVRSVGWSDLREVSAFRTPSGVKLALWGRDVTDCIAVGLEEAKAIGVYAELLRLTGFDTIAVDKATAGTGRERFVCWRPRYDLGL
jgi:hypothetical protein